MQMRWLTLLAAAISVAGQQSDDPFKPLEFLIGDWVGEGGSKGGPGQGSGEFSFQYDLQRKVLVRKNNAVYPPQGGRAGYRHDDLMIVYREGKALRAMYFDSEDHVIRYAVEPSAGVVTFLSDPVPDQPRYRLIYRKTGATTASLDFEIAPPGKPDAFQNYITAAVRRKEAK
jgi:hypothetical protein